MAKSNKKSGKASKAKAAPTKAELDIMDQIAAAKVALKEHKSAVKAEAKAKAKEERDAARKEKAEQKAVARSERKEAKDAFSAAFKAFRSGPSKDTLDELYTEGKAFVGAFGKKD